MSKVWRTIMLVAAALLAIFAVYLLVGPDGRRTSLLKRLETEGLVAQGKVVEKYIEEYQNYDGSGSRPGKRSLARIINDHNRRIEKSSTNYLYFVEVEFKTAQGRQVRSKENIPGENFDGLAIGAQVPILYHPEDPEEITRLRDHAPPYLDMSDLRRIIAMFILAVAAVLFWFGRPKGEKAEATGESDWQNAASSRIETMLETRDAPSQVARSRRVAAGRPGAPKQFGQARRSVRT